MSRKAAWLLYPIKVLSYHIRSIVQSWPKYFVNNNAIIIIDALSDTQQGMSARQPNLGNWQVAPLSLRKKIFNVLCARIRTTPNQTFERSWFHRRSDHWLQKMSLHRVNNVERRLAKLRTGCRKNRQRIDAHTNLQLAWKSNIELLGSHLQSALLSLG
jgi:hypothetical protein